MGLPLDTTNPPECVVACGCRLAEAPVWVARSEMLCWLDIAVESTLFAWHYRTGAVRRWPLRELATGLALSDRGEIVVLSENGLSVFDLAQPGMRRLTAPNVLMHGMRFNDCGCDRLGRLWTGTMVNDLRGVTFDGSRTGELCRFGPDLSSQRLSESVGCPNTFAWALDDSTLYTADSATGCIYAYPFDLASGALGERRIFANPSNLGIPDGSAVDRQGCLWNARWGAACVARFAPDGALLEVVHIPADFVTSCAFGGAELDILFVTTARHTLTGAELARQPLAGGIFAFKPAVPGVASTAFRWNRLRD